MTFIRLGKERESLVMRSELYKEHAIFNKLETEQVYKLKEKCIETLSSSQNKKVKAMAGEMGSVSHDILRAFVYESEIIEADIDSLKKAVSMRLPDVGVSSSILDILPNQTVSERLIQTGKPHQIEEQLLSNLFPLIDYPKTIWAADTNLRRKGEVFREFEGDVTLPAFTLKESRLLSFQNLSEATNPFSKLLISRLIRYYRNGQKWRLMPSLQLLKRTEEVFLYVCIFIKDG